MEILLTRLEQISILFFEGMAEERFYDCFILMTERTSILHELGTKAYSIPMDCLQKIKSETIEMNVLLEEVMAQKRALIDKEQNTFKARSSYAASSDFNPLLFIGYDEGRVNG